jgi:hypothetical protein
MGEVCRSRPAARVVGVAIAVALVVVALDVPPLGAAAQPPSGTASANPDIGGRITQPGGAPVAGACVVVGDLGTAVADGLGRWSFSFDEDPDFIWPIAVLPPFDTGAGPCDPTSGWPEDPSPGDLVPEIFPNRAVAVSTIASAVDGVNLGFSWIVGVSPGNNRIDVCLQTDPVESPSRPDCLPRYRMAGRVTASVDAAPPQPYEGACAILVGRGGLLGASFSGPDGRWVMPDLPTEGDYVLATSARQPDGAHCLESENGPARVGERGLRIEIFDNREFPEVEFGPDVEVIDGLLGLGATQLTSSRSDLDVCLSNLPASQTTPDCRPSPPPPSPPVSPPVVPTVTPARAVHDFLVWPFRTRRQRGVRAGDLFAYRLVDHNGGVTGAFVVVDDLIVRGFRRFRIDVVDNDVAAAGLTPQIVIAPRRGRLVPLWDGSFLYVRYARSSRR